MEVTKKVFWKEALRGGTIIGLVSCAFSLLSWAIGGVETGFWGKLVSIASLVVFVALIYAYTRNISRRATPAEGFSYGRGVGFVIAMMLFTGIIKGTYMAIMNNFVDPAAITESIDQVMVIIQDMMPSDQFDQTYSAVSKLMFNPVYLVFASVLNSIVGGLIVGLLVSAFTKRDPDIFAEERGGTE